MQLDSLSYDNTYARLPEDFFRRVTPTPLAEPHLVALNPDAVALLGLDGLSEQAVIGHFSGAEPLPGGDPLAMLYAGNQFGSWVPQLGDGRAILLGEVLGADGQRWDLQLKGAGITPFSRQGDGRAVLRSVIREYLCSEAMAGLNIPTTRALCIVGSNEPVPRERIETGAMMVRLSPSHVRFGTFQVFASRKQYDHLKTLADYVIEHHFPHLAGQPDAYPALLTEIAQRTGELVARWQCDGFVHGVLNSDNMSVLGLTIDYGPYAFMDGYQHDYVRNHTDRAGFYAYNRQPDIGRYNCYLLATAMVPLMDTEQAQAGLDAYLPAYTAAYQARMREKLGMITVEPEDIGQDDGLVEELFALMHRGEADFAGMFRGLSEVTAGQATLPKSCAALLPESLLEDAAQWFGRYGQRLSREPVADAARQVAMNRVNPLYLLRTHLAQRAIDLAEAGEFAEIERLRVLLTDPYTERPDMADYAAPPAADDCSSMLSCSS